MIVKVFNIPNKEFNYKLPTNIVKHCNIYKEEAIKKASLFAWSKLSKYIDLSKVKFNKQGKPYLVGNKKYFSLSHSLNKVAIAVSNKPVGVDIEVLLPKLICVQLAQRLLNKKELKQYFNARDREIWLTKWWTQHEAYIKMIGNKATLKNFTKPIIGKVTSTKIKESETLIYLLSTVTK